MIELTQPSQEPPRKAAIRQAAFRRALGLAPPAMKAPSVSLLIMAKNEGDTLERCVKSALPLVDQVVIGVDSNSDDQAARLVRAVFDHVEDRDLQNRFTDFLNAPSRRGRTARKFRKVRGFPDDMTRTHDEIAQWVKSNVSRNSHNKIFLDTLSTYCSTWNVSKRLEGEIQDKPVEVVEFEWERNFSKVRNLLKEKCTGDWILWLDGHEYLEDGAADRIRMVLDVAQANEKVQSLALKVYMEDDPAKESLVQPRVVRNHEGPMWERAQHNKVIGTDYQEANAYVPGARIIHDRPLWVQNMRKPQRIAHGLEVMKWWKGETYYAGATAYDSGHYVRALILYWLHLRKCDNPAERARVQVSIARAFKQWGWRKTFRKLCLAAIGENPAAATAWVNLVEDTMEEAKAIEEFEKREAVYKKALEMARFTCTLTLPKTGVGILESHYTWGPRYQCAKICFEVGRLKEAREWAVECLGHNPPEEFRTELESNIREWDEFEVTQLNDHFRKPEEIGKRPKRLLIVDKLGQFSLPIGQHIANRGWEVQVTARFEKGLFYWADVIYTDWADELAAQYSHMPKFDRRLIVHLRSYEMYGNMPRQIAWENVDWAVFEGRHVEQKTRIKFDFENYPNLKTLTIPNGVDAYDFRPLKSGPFTKDIVTLSFLNHKKGIQLLAVIAAAFPEWTFHVGGYWQDEMLADYCEHFFNRCELKNVRMYGEVKDPEKAEFLKRGSVFLSTSIKEGHAFAALEAAACGLHVVSHDYPGSDPIKRMGGQVWATLADLRGILDKLPSRHVKKRAGKTGWEANFAQMQSVFSIGKMLKEYERIITKAEVSHENCSGKDGDGDQEESPGEGAESRCQVAHAL